MIRYILTDIEGTTTSIDFVHKVLFPFSLHSIDSFLDQNFERDTNLQAIVNDIWFKDLKNPLTVVVDLSTIKKTLKIWIESDQKNTNLKLIQGMIWRKGYQQRLFHSHVYEDVPQILNKWKQSGIGLGIYSSGSTDAQQLLFKHTPFGDLTPLFSDFFDTKIGHKRQTSSYVAISNSLKLPPAEILFLSDTHKELDAARQAGMKTCQIFRESPKNSTTHPSALDFIEVDSKLSRI